MTQYERMLAGLIYDPADPQILTEQAGFAERLWAFNQRRPRDTAEKEQYMREVFASCGGGQSLPRAPRHRGGGPGILLPRRKNRLGEPVSRYPFCCSSARHCLGDTP